MPKEKAKTTQKVESKPATTKKAALKATREAAGTIDLVKRYRSHKGDTGSTDIQVIGVTEKINQLTTHLDSHHNDQDSRRGLLIMVGKRRRLLNYLKRQDEATYTKLITDLGLRK